MIRDREALILASQLPRKEAGLLVIDEQARTAADRLDRAERDTEFLFSILVAVIAMGAFVTGAQMLDSDLIGPAQAVRGLTDRSPR